MTTTAFPPLPGITPGGANEAEAKPMSVGASVLHVAVLLESQDTVPKWVGRAIELLAACAHVDVSSLTVDPPPYSRPARRTFSMAPLVRRVDAKLFGHRPNPMAAGRIDLPLRPVANGLQDPYAVLVLGTRGTDLLPPTMPVWSITFGPNGTQDPGAAAEAAVVTGKSTIEARLVQRAPDGTMSVLASNVTGTSPYSIRRTRDRMLWTAVSLPMRAVLQTLHGRPNEGPWHPGPSPSLGVRDWIAYGRRVAAKLASRAFTTEWILAYKLSDEPVVADDLDAEAVAAFTVVPQPPDRFWADPFVVQHEGRRWLFVEEWPRSAPHARIAAMELRADGLGEPITALARPYHLSYPHVFEWQGSFYMVPETMANRTVELYRCHRFPDDWRLERVLMDNVRAVDSTIVEIDGRWWMFTGIAPEHGVENDQLHLFMADSPLGPWRPHPMNPVVSDVRRARPAGQLFRDRSGWIRPSQDCSARYGRALVFNRIRTITPERYAEEPVSTILPTWTEGIAGTHTFNHAAGATVVDGARPRLRFGR